ncbi:MAG TPA: hypothetical protein VIH83_04280 [Candidatus Bathyarchaeia archaeon]
MRESTLRSINYLAIIAVLISLTLHFATHGFLGVAGFEDSLTYASVIDRYRASITAIMLAVLLLGASYHGLLGLRNILLEIKTGRLWTRGVTIGTATLGAVMVGWGLRTIIVTITGA